MAYSRGVLKIRNAWQPSELRHSSHSVCPVCHSTLMLSLLCVSPSWKLLLLLLPGYAQSCFKSSRWTLAVDCTGQWTLAVDCAGQWTLAVDCAGQQSQQALQTYIGQIKEVMPNFGDGFLAAALQHFSYNSEQVIHTLLEGDLPPELKGLDPQMALPAAGTTGRGAAQPNSNGASLCGCFILHCNSVYPGFPV